MLARITNQCTSANGTIILTCNWAFRLQIAFEKKKMKNTKNDQLGQGIGTGFCVRKDSVVRLPWPKDFVSRFLTICHNSDLLPQEDGDNENSLISVCKR